MNNYTQSDTGIDIDLSVFYDDGQSQWNFQDNFTNLVGDTWWYKTWDNIPAPTNFDDLFVIESISTETIFEILHECHSYNATGLEEYFETNDEALTELVANYSFPEGLSDFVEMLDTYYLPYTKLFVRTTSSGYSSSDYAEVFIPNQIREEYGLADNIDLADHCKQTINSLFWDSPLTARITINDEEYFSDTYDGAYEVSHYPVAERTQYNHLEWDKDIFIAEVLTNFPELDQQLLKSELESLVPTELSYS